MLALETWADTAAARLVAAGLCGGSVTRNRETPSRDDALPTADVFVTEDEGQATGGGVTGPVAMRHTAKLAIEIRDHDNDGAALRVKLRGHVQKVYDTLLPTFWLWAAEAEGCGGARFTYVTPPEAGETEGRALIQIDILWRSVWTEDVAALPELAEVSVDVGSTGIGATITPPQS
ncbi:MAG: hypothetical protein AB7K67_00890 [Hyphomicrobiaceae bacterium]